MEKIDSNLANISSCLEKISQAKKVSKLEKDPILSLLILQPKEAITNARAILKESDNTRQLYEMIGKIEKIIKDFDEERPKLSKKKWILI